MFPLPWNEPVQSASPPRWWAGLSENTRSNTFFLTQIVSFRHGGHRYTTLISIEALSPSPRNTPWSLGPHNPISSPTSCPSQHRSSISCSRRGSFPFLSKPPLCQSAPTLGIAPSSPREFCPLDSLPVTGSAALSGWEGSSSGWESSWLHCNRFRSLLINLQKSPHPWLPCLVELNSSSEHVTVHYPARASTFAHLVMARVAQPWHNWAHLCLSETDPGSYDLDF